MTQAGSDTAESVVTCHFGVAVTEAGRSLTRLADSEGNGLFAS
jgi:hypothetical protein